MDHNLSYRGPILVIQKPNINLSNIVTISLKNASPNSHFFSQPKISPKNLDSSLAKIGQLGAVLENEP